MTKVKDIIRNSVFKKAKGFDDLKPELSIFLPTYKRGDNGLFERSLKSILEQDFKNFELIIIDDASVDSTASIIEKYMKEDARISVIRHNENIGLAAVSEIEALLKSRGQKTLCAFDDNNFTKDGIQALMDDQKNNPEHLITHGWMKLFVKDQEYVVFGRKKVDYSMFYMENQVGHSSVLVDRKVFDEVGYFDPHFAVIRCWDWDLWMRAADKFSFYNIDKEIVSEFGITQADSLGNTVVYDNTLVNMWRQKNRNEQLLPINLLEYEFDSFPGFVGRYFKQSLCDVVYERFRNRFLSEFTASNNEGYILVVADNYSNRLNKDNHFLLFVTYYEFNVDFYKYILGAKAVVFYKTMPYDMILYKLSSVDISFYYISNDIRCEKGVPLDIISENLSDLITNPENKKVFERLYNDNYCIPLQRVLDVVNPNFYAMDNVCYNFRDLLKVLKNTGKYYRNKFLKKRRSRK